jgi:hypothetical protein
MQGKYNILNHGESAGIAHDQLRLTMQELPEVKKRRGTDA